MPDSTIFSLLIIFLDNLSSYFILGIYMFAAINEKTDWKLLGKLLAVTLISSTAWVYFLYLVSGLPTIAAYALGSILTYLLTTVVLMHLQKWGFWRSFAVVGIGAILQVATGSVLSSVIRNISLSSISSLLYYAQQMYILYPLVSWVICMILRKLHFGRPIRYLLDHTRNICRTALAILALEISMEICFTFRLGLTEETILSYNATVIILAFLLVCILMYLALRLESSHKIQLQKSMLLQQQMYLENLEELQKEMRSFRHDYKNMLSGMYQYAQDGDMEEIQKALRELEIDFDQKIGEKIRMTTQIGNIRLPEVKSLILSKLTKMHEKNISCRLEVLYPFSETGMEVWDFNRCLGILLDNAIEEAEKCPHPEIELLLLYQNGYLTVRVANPCEGKIDISRIWEEGSSTKGNDRGLGLASYRRILESYPGAAPMTSLENHTFIQEFTIGV